jgi:hypothetical protein
MIIGNHKNGGSTAEKPIWGFGEIVAVLVWKASLEEESHIVIPLILESYSKMPS